MNFAINGPVVQSEVRLTTLCFGSLAEWPMYPRLNALGHNFGALQPDRS